MKPDGSDVAKLNSLLLRAIQSPTMFGTPYSASGWISALAAAIVTTEVGSAAVAVRRVTAAETAACADVAKSKCQAVLLCEESATPERIASWDALRRHGLEMLRILEQDGLLQIPADFALNP